MSWRPRSTISVHADGAIWIVYGYGYNSDGLLKVLGRATVGLFSPAELGKIATQELSAFRALPKIETSDIVSLDGTRFKSWQTMARSCRNASVIQESDNQYLIHPEAYDRGSLIPTERSTWRHCKADPDALGAMLFEMIGPEAPD